MSVSRQTLEALATRTGFRPGTQSRRSRLQGRHRHPAQAPDMPWTVACADAIIALRRGKLSGRFEAFWDRLAQRKAVARQQGAHS